MGHFIIDGPTEVSPELAMALFNSMPEVGRAGVAQMFCSRLMSGPLAESAIAAAAKVYMERVKLGETGAKALRAGIAAKCKALGEKQVNPAQVQAIVEDETRRASAELAKAKVGELLSAIPLEALVASATPIVAEVVRQCAHHYFTRSQPGQDWLLALIHKVCEEETATVRASVAEVLCETADPVINRVTAAMPKTRKRTGNAGDNGEA
jgi:hypothetical protein